MADTETTGESDKQLTQEQRAKIIEKLTELLGDKPCEMCGHPNFALNARVGSPLLLAITEDGSKYMAPDLSVAHPAAVLHCLQCGNLKMFSLRTLGFDPVEARTKEEAVKSDG